MRIIYNTYHRAVRYISCVLITLVVLLLGSCTQDGDVVDNFSTNTQENKGQLDSGNGMYVQLLISCEGEAVTRVSNPTPGQDGDGREPGIGDENHIYDVCIFIYDGGDKYVNAPADTRIIASAYATENQLVKRNTTSGAGYDGAFSRETLPVKIPRIPVSQNTQIVVVANMGNILNENIQTLGELRDRIVAKSWEDNSNPELCSHFTMASSSISYISNLAGGTEDNPIRFECNIERTMARVDFCWLQTPRFSQEGYDVYDVVSRVDASLHIGEVYVTNMRLFNVKQTPSYILKRVAHQLGENTTYLGRETVSPNGIANNYVVEPTTIFKTRDNRTNNEMLKTWYGDTRVKLLTEELINSEQAKFPYKSKYLRNMDFRGKSVKGFIMAYANENTMDATQACGAYCTGILFETIYKPSVVYNYNKSTKTLSVNTSYSLGDTFAHYVRVSGEMDEKNNLCFTTEQQARDYLSDHSDEVANIITYTGGRSYYHMWIRHANDGVNETNSPMEFGIVRNNIYRIAVKAFNGPGQVKPTPEEDVMLVQPYIFVKPWELVVMPDVLM